VSAATGQDRADSAGNAAGPSAADPAIDLGMFERPAGRDPAEIDRFLETWSAPPGLIGWFRTVNNIPIAKRFMLTAFAFFLFGGAQALLLRIQLGSPENTFLDPATYNQIFTMHGTTMMFLFVIPFIEAVSNYLMPLLLGTRDLPFPRLTALSFWTYFFGGLFMYSSFLFGAAPDGGWFAYVPLTGPEYSPGINMDWWDIGLSVAEVAAMGAAAELLISILRVRAPGMSLDRLPVFAWSMLVAAVMIIFAFTPLIAGTALLELDRKGLTVFFDPERGGAPLLWQHLFWFFGHPEVYIMFLPATGIVSQVVQTFSRRPLVGYPLIVAAILSTGFLSFGLWVHHMFTTGLAPTALGYFTGASVLIAIPTGVQMFCWIATLWTGTPQWRTPLLFAGGAFLIFLLGGLTGVMVAVVPFNAMVHDSYFIVAHFHYVLIGGVVFPLFAGLYYWLPKITGRLCDERLGRWSFGIMFGAFHVAFFPMHILGLLGMPRRVYTYPSGLGWDVLNLVVTIGAFAFAAGILLSVWNWVRSRSKGAEAGRDPWGGDTLEWSQESPPADAQFAAIPVVRSRHPLWRQDDLEPHDAGLRRQLDALDWRPPGWRATLLVSVLEGRPLAIAYVPGPTIWPFVMSIAFVLLFAGLLFDSVWTLAAGGLLTAAALIGWFLPQESGTRAAAEYDAHPADDRLPLAVAGPLANGWWGALVLDVILAVALATLVACYVYLAQGADATLGGAIAVGAPYALAAAAAPVLAAALLWVGTRGLPRSGEERRDGNGGWRGLLPLSLAAALALAVGGGAAALQAWSATGVPADSSALASAVATLYGFQVVAAVLLAATAAAALAWAITRPEATPGHAFAFTCMLVGLFAAASGVVVAATVLGVPHVL